VAAAFAVGVLHAGARLWRGVRSPREGRGKRSGPEPADEFLLLLAVAGPPLAAQLGLSGRVPGPGPWLAAFPVLAVLGARALLTCAATAWAPRGRPRSGCRATRGRRPRRFSPRSRAMPGPGPGSTGAPCRPPPWQCTQPTVDSARTSSRSPLPARPTWRSFRSRAGDERRSTGSGQRSTRPHPWPELTWTRCRWPGSTRARAPGADPDQLPRLASPETFLRARTP